ncbi:MAG: AraC family transcriptional regulator [Clostridia bacterium]|nr:AraC family transcriptional regulator [Clostridia bacterium]
MRDCIKADNAKIYYFNPSPQNSNNGLYFIRMGENMPDKNYYVERYGDTRRKLGGIYVLEYVISGEGYIECDGKVYHVKGGDFYFLNRGYAHRYYSDKENPMNKIWLNCAGPYVGAVVSSLGITEGVYCSHFDAESLFKRLRDLLVSVDYKNMDRVYDRAALVVTEILLSAATANRIKHYENEDVIYEVKRFVDSESGLCASLDDICTKFYQNKSYLIFRFRKEFGITPHKYILQRKMEAAKEMLASGNMQIKEISNLLGFASSQYFSSAFRTHFGKTPVEYRDEMHSPNKEGYLI